MKNLAPPRPRSISWEALLKWLSHVVDSLEVKLTNDELEEIAIGIYTSMSGPLRRFHTLEHIFKFKPRDAIETLAVMYHDVVYINVDGGYPDFFRDKLFSVAHEALAGTKITSETDIPHYKEILAIFGLVGGDELPKTGINELMSAFSFASAWGKKVHRDLVLQVVACIEATIPFRGFGAREALFKRLTALGLNADLAHECLKRATHMANQDVQDFSLDDIGLFLGGTWNLLPELNSDLRISSYYSIIDYRKALFGMDQFFAFLKPDILYEAWLDEPGPGVLEDLRSRSLRNLGLAREYLWAKLFASALLEAFALVTGKDVPLSMFMGSAIAPPKHRLEALLPELSPPEDPGIIFKLLSQGRATQSSFDLTNSPLAAWIYQQMSHEEREVQTIKCLEFFRRDKSPKEFLADFNRSIVSQLGMALAEFVPTRSEKISTFLKSLTGI